MQVQLKVKDTWTQSGRFKEHWLQESQSRTHRAAALERTLPRRASRVSTARARNAELPGHDGAFAPSNSTFETMCGVCQAAPLQTPSRRWGPCGDAAPGCSAWLGKCSVFGGTTRFRPCHSHGRPQDSSIPGTPSTPSTASTASTASFGATCPLPSCQTHAFLSGAGCRHTRTRDAHEYINIPGARGTQKYRVAV